MSKKLIEIRWHGRGGQGAVTAAKILAEAALSEGKYIQAFPEYGPERTGAPVKSFTRISDEPIRIHSQVTSPDIVVVLNSTLIGPVDVTEGVSEEGVIIVNTNESPDKMRQKMGFTGGKVYVVDATSIALNKLGRNIPNTPMVGAVIKTTKVVKLETILADFKKKFSKKFKEEVIKGNLEAIETAHNEVKG